MKSLTTLKNLYGSLSQNTSTANLTLGQQLINDQHRYLIQKYFDNERTVQTTTVGSQDLTTTASLAANDTSATLTAVWAYPTCTQLVNFSNGDQRSVLFTYNSAAISWVGGLSDTATTAITTVGVQNYNIPANVSKIKDDTISVGQLKYVLIPVQTRAEWDLINFLPYTSDIPQYYFIYDGKLGIFPIPSTTGNIITFNYKTRVIDMTFADYSTGTIDTAGMVAGSTTVTGLNTSWVTTGGYPSGVDISSYNLYLRADPPYGDGIWYPIYKVNSNTSITLALPVVSAPNITNATTYTIGQFPLLQEDFHDMIVNGALMVYFGSVSRDESKFKMFDGMYKSKLDLLADYAGTKSVSVDLGEEPNFQNPNLFLYSNS